MIYRDGDVDDNGDVLFLGRRRGLRTAAGRRIGCGKGMRHGCGSGMRQVCSSRMRKGYGRGMCATRWKHGCKRACAKSFPCTKKKEAKKGEEIVMSINDDKIDTNVQVA